MILKKSLGDSGGEDDPQSGDIGLICTSLGISGRGIGLPIPAI